MKSFLPVLLGAFMALTVQTMAVPLDYDILAKRDAAPSLEERKWPPDWKREAVADLSERKWPPDWKREAVPDLAERKWPPDWKREAEAEPEPEVKRDAEPGCYPRCT